MRRSWMATIGLAVATVIAIAAGVAPSLTDVLRTDRVLMELGAPDGDRPPLRLHAADGPVAGLRTGFLHVPELGGGAHRVRVGVVAPTGTPTADVLFVHGHADRLDNHARLFAEFRAAGMRVISFDLPSHGETDAGPIDRWTFDDLAALATTVVRATEDDPDRPFVLAGWSFGGLLATRFVQSPEVLSAFGRPVRALALESPAIVPWTFAGGDGISRLRALTHDLRAPVAGPPSPASPFLDPVFAGRLVAQAKVAVATPLPAAVPTVVEVGGDEDDRYVDVDGVRAWASDVAGRAGAHVDLVRCAGGRHGLDIEAWPVGPAATHALVSFVADRIGAPIDGPTGPGADAVTEACR